MKKKKGPAGELRGEKGPRTTPIVGQQEKKGGPKKRHRGRPPTWWRRGRKSEIFQDRTREAKEMVGVKGKNLGGESGDGNGPRKSL